jgi:predicted HAD superfamily Cof-like phosphohydrolase
MASKWVNDINTMHRKYGVHQWVANKLMTKDKESLRKFLEFRLGFINEELQETIKATSEADPEEIVDGLIDICVVAISTLDAFGVDADKAWDQVQKANMKKEVGVKESRPNPLGLPDLVKPRGWEAPEHKSNHGYFRNTF